MIGQKIVLCVAQHSFDLNSDGGPMNTSSMLVPLLLEDGVLPAEEDFPNNGLVFWMLRPGVSFGEPGRLVSGVIELARQHPGDDPVKALYQVDRESIEPVKRDDVIEVVTVADGALTVPRDLVTRRRVVSLDHPPATSVLVRWHGQLYGPLRASAELVVPERNEYAVSFGKLGPTHPVFVIPEGRLAGLRRKHFPALNAVIAVDRAARSRSTRIVTCHYELVLGSAVDSLLEAATDKLPLETNAELLGRAAKDLMTRKKSQEFRSLVRDLGEALELDGEPRPDTVSVVSALSQELESQEVAGLELARALLESGLLDEHLRTRNEERLREYIAEHAAQLQADINERIEELRVRRDTLTQEMERLEDEIESRRLEAVAALERELAERTGAAEREIETERAHLDAQREELDRQRDLVRGNLERVAEQFKSARHELVNQFLALAPLLEQTGLLWRRQGDAQGQTRHGSRNERETDRPAPLQFPTFVTTTAVTGTEVQDELVFFERFRQHVASSGFVYRELDLLSFHVSVKCCDITVLGGLSGTGKSSLPQLYSEALHGVDESRAGRYLRVAVSPSWLDMRDLIGHVNALEGRFEPGESGLYQQMIFAQEEYRRRGPGSGLYLACLDEMNLSHVEHYFGGFLQALEDRNRSVRCFAVENVRADSLFRQWPTLDLPRSVRFIGTVNLDETTKELSARLLDRVNFIRLRPDRLSDIPLEPRQEPRPVDGPAVDLRTYRSWCATGRLEREFASLVDTLRPHLFTLGCPLNPRRYRAVCQFVASTPRDLCSPVQALDLQIAQRVVPQIRRLFRRAQQEAVARVAEILEAYDSGFPETIAALREVRDVEYGPEMLDEE